MLHCLSRVYTVYTINTYEGQRLGLVQVAIIIMLLPRMCMRSKSKIVFDFKH